ncbi:MAG: DUF3568 family protein [Myxococcota bacterium]
MRLDHGLLAGALLVSAQLGCTAAAVGGAALAGAGAVAYLKGDVNVVENVSLSNAWLATEQAMDDLDYTIVSRQGELQGKKLVGRSADDRRVEIRLSTRGPRATQIGIRVGIFGDEETAWRILRTIRQRM